MLQHNHYRQIDQFNKWQNQKHKLIIPKYEIHNPENHNRNDYPWREKQ